MAANKRNLSFWGKPYYKWANIILVSTAIAYIIVLWLGLFHSYGSWYDGLYWIIQSAFIGSVADWFAVNALFRKPLGIPFHTALVPRKKASLVQTFVDFVENHLLSKESMTELIHKTPLVLWVHRFMESSSGRQFMRQTLAKVLEPLKGERTQALIAEKLEQLLLRVPIQDLASRWIQNNYSQNEEYYMAIMMRIDREIQGPAAWNFIRRQFDERLAESHFLKREIAKATVDFDDVTTALIKEIRYVVRESTVVGTTSHQLFYGMWQELLQSIMHKQGSALILEEVYEKWIKGLPFSRIVENHIFLIVKEYVRINKLGESLGATFLEERIHGLWNMYKENEAFQNRLESILQEIAIALLHALHDIIGTIITAVLSNFNEAEFNAFIEDKIGYDLGWIRINGAIVGGCIGLGVWLFLEGLYMPYIVPFIAQWI